MGKDISNKGGLTVCVISSQRCLNKYMIKHGGCRPSVFVQYLISASKTNMRPNSANAIPQVLGWEDE